MNRTILFALGILVTTGALSATVVKLRSPRGEAADAAATAIYRSGLDRLDTALLQLDGRIAAGRQNEAQRAFREARAAFKRIEMFAEYYGKFAVRELNGVPLPFAESEDPETPLAPVGLQVVEPILFPKFDADRTAEARQLIIYMRRGVQSLRMAGADTIPGDSYVFDAARQEIARVATLGIAGFDAAVTGDAIVESAEALAGIQDALVPYRPALSERSPAALQNLDKQFAAAIAYLRARPDFDHFDRIEFIARHVQPTAHALVRAQEALGIGAPPKLRAWSAKSASIYDSDAFDPAFYAALDASAPTPELITLGRRLFFDPALSPSGTRSCATCHMPERAFTDGRARASLLDAHTPVHRARNTPTLINAALQPTLFDDNRVRTLEDQATDVLGSRNEMGGSLKTAAATVRLRDGYKNDFAAAFGVARDSAVTPQRLRLALAAYVRSLRATNSRFDRAARGDLSALTAEERDGFTLFMGKAKCGTCHFAPLFNGATPPWLTEAEPEVIGVPLRALKRGAVIDPDSGRFNVRRIDQHLHAFRTPTLRNIELTAPYMHNGVFKTLDEVIDFYDGGGGHGIGIDLAHQTLPVDSLHLTRVEKKAVIAFLRALTDTVGAR